MPEEFRLTNQSAEHENMSLVPAPGKLSDSRHGLGKWNDDRCPVNRIIRALEDTKPIVCS